MPRYQSCYSCNPIVITVANNNIAASPEASNFLTKLGQEMPELDVLWLHRA